MNEHFYNSRGYRVFKVFNFIILSVVTAACIYPIVNTLAISFSSKLAVASGKVFLWPVEFTMDAYSYLLSDSRFWGSMTVSIKRLALGGAVNILICILTAFPLSKSDKVFPARKKYVTYILITMLFTGGLVPTFFVVRYSGIYDTIWALILPIAVPVYNIIIMMNFFRQLPVEMEEAAYIDGADHWQVLWKIYIPTSLPVLATVGLFILVMHWNEWFGAMLYIRRIENYPLQSYLRTRVIDNRMSIETLDDLDKLKKISQRTYNSAQLFIAMIPILVVYPFLQKYFTKGLILGSVKG
jgi:putative aldouronate transport system permease protein